MDFRNPESNKPKSGRNRRANRLGAVIASLAIFFILVLLLTKIDRTKLPLPDSGSNSTTVSTLRPPVVDSIPDIYTHPVSGINVASFGARGDGHHNDTRAIQRTIDKASAGSRKAVYIPAGTYRVTSTIHLRDGISLVGAGRAVSILKMDAGEQSLLDIGKADKTRIAHLQIRDIIDRGDNESWGIVVTSGSNNTIEDVRVVNSDDAGIRIGYSHKKNSKNCRVINCEVINTKEGSGIEIIKSENAIVSGNDIMGSSQHGIRLCGAINANVSGNRLRENSNGISIQGFTTDNVLEQAVEGFVVADNECADNTNSGINVFNSAINGVVEDNLITSTGKYEPFGIFVYTPANHSALEYLQTPYFEKAAEQGNYNIAIRRNTVIGGARGLNLRGTNGKLHITENRISNWSLRYAASYGVYIDASVKQGVTPGLMRDIYIEHNYLSNKSDGDYGIRAFNLTGDSRVFVRYNTVSMPADESRRVGYAGGDSIITTDSGEETNKPKSAPDS